MSPSRSTRSRSRAGTETDGTETDSTGPDGTGPARRSPRRTARRLRDVIGEARAEFQMLTGRSVESVSAVHRSDAGWTMSFEVVELERVPSSTSVLGTYEVELDGEGGVVDFQRTRRYYRNQASEAES